MAADLSYTGFAGIQNTLDAKSLGKGRVADAVDGYFDAAQVFEALPVPTARDGIAWRTTCGGLGVAADGALYRIGSPAIALQAQLAGDHLAGVEPGGVYFITDGEQGLIVSADSVRPWGFPEPALAITYGAGALRAGLYRVACTWVLDDGRESSATVVDVQAAEASSLILTHVAAAPASAVLARVYVSDRDGTELYQRREVAAALASVTVITLGEAGPVLESAEAAPMPAGQCVAVWGARLVVGVGKEVFVSVPYQPHLHQTLLRYRFEGEVRALAGVDSGLVVGTSVGTWFLPGLDAQAAALSRVNDAPVLLQNPTFVRAGDFPYGDGTLPAGVLLVTRQGVLYVSDAGEATPLTANVFHIPAGERASGAVVPLGGGAQFVFTVEE